MAHLKVQVRLPDLAAGSSPDALEDMVTRYGVGHTR